MVNMNVGYAGPSLSLLTLTKELTARFGTPSRWYEFVTGWKSPANITSHNADNNGRAHAVDIFVGPGHNISVDQGIDLAERLRLEGKKGVIAGHPDRMAYIIHRRRIAGDHTNWEWVPYTGAEDHYDHIHISGVYDFPWGDPIWGVSHLDYNSTAAWNLWSSAIPTPAPSSPAVKPQGSVDRPTSWIVDPGDTMGAIAVAVGVTLSSLLAVNPGVYPNHIQPKQVLKLPANAKWPTAQAPAKPAPVKPAPAKPASAQPIAPVNRYVGASGANARVSPSRSARIAVTLAVGAPVAVIGYVAGEAVTAGNNAWYKTKSGYYVWANAAGDNISGLPYLGQM